MYTRHLLLLTYSKVIHAELHMPRCGKGQRFVDEQKNTSGEQSVMHIVSGQCEQ